MKIDRYQPRTGFFRCPGTYSVDLEDGFRLACDVDRNGHFDFAPPQPPIGLMARFVDPETDALLLLERSDRNVEVALGQMRSGMN